MFESHPETICLLPEEVVDVLPEASIEAAQVVAGTSLSHLQHDVELAREILTLQATAGNCVVLRGHVVAGPAVLGAAWEQD